MTDFSERTVLVTGGGTGIGKGCAEHFLARGAMVTIAGPDGEVLASAATSLRQSTGRDAVRTAVCDVTDEDTVRHAVDVAAEEGRLDVCIANAGTGFPGPVQLLEKAHWHIPFDVNVVGTALCIKHSARLMKQADSGACLRAIVAISSVDAVRANRFMPTYNVTKAAVDSLVAASARELARFGIRVNGVRPGLVMTDTIRQVLPEGMRQNEVSRTYLGRAGTPEDIARAVAFLASEDASWITGQMLNVCGGLSVHDGDDFEPLARLAFGDSLIDDLG